MSLTQLLDKVGAIKETTNFRQAVRAFEKSVDSLGVRYYAVGPMAPVNGHDVFAVAIVARRGALRTEPGPEATWEEVTPNLGWLLLGSVLAAGLVNAGPLATALLAEPSQDKLVTQFGYGVLLARVPLFLFQAVQAALLPRLARLAAQRNMVEFRRGFDRLMMVVVTVGVIGVVGAFLLGPTVVNRVYDATLTRRTLAMLALGSACYMIALATAQAVIALHGHAFVAAGWLLGMASFVVTTWLSGSTADDVFRRVELGLVVGPAIAMVAFAWALRRQLRHGWPPDDGSILDALSDRPIDG